MAITSSFFAGVDSVDEVDGVDDRDRAALSARLGEGASKHTASAIRSFRKNAEELEIESVPVFILHNSYFIIQLSSFAAISGACNCRGT